MRVSVRRGPQPVHAAFGLPLVSRDASLRVAADKAPIMVWMLAPTSGYVFFNRAWLAFTGRTLEQEVGWGWLEGVHRSDRDSCIQHCRRTLATKDPLLMEHRLRRADGQFRRVLAHGQPLLDATGRLRAYVGSSVDVTDLKPLSGKKSQSFETREAALQQLARGIAAARAEERADLARELHDGLDQTLTAIKFELRRATTVFKKDGLRPQAVDRLQSLMGLADIGIATVKRLATNLRSISIDNRGLLPAIRWEATAYRARTGVRCDVHAASESTALTLEQQTIVFRVLQEALTNVARHADASAVSIDLTERRGVFELQVRDNGRGITAAQKSHPRSIGLLGMRERVALAGGVLEIRGRRGKGTTVVVRVKAGRRFARTAEPRGTRG